VISKTLLLQQIQNASQMAGADRAPVMRIIIGKGELAVMMSNDEIGLFGDVIELDAGQAMHNRITLKFTPRMFIDALNNAPNDKVKLKYNPEKTNLPVGLDGDSGYEVWIAPRSEKTPNQ
jgi:DNA polymerase III sliding clamp (beta) subunit (PCNA family)